MIFDAASGEMYEGTHYMGGGSDVWMWGDGILALSVIQTIPGAEWSVSQAQTKWKVTSISRPNWSLIRTRTHWVCPEE